MRAIVQTLIVAWFLSTAGIASAYYCPEGTGISGPTDATALAASLPPELLQSVQAELEELFPELQSPVSRFSHFFGSTDSLLRDGAAPTAPLWCSEDDPRCSPDETPPPRSGEIAVSSAAADQIDSVDLAARGWTRASLQFDSGPTGRRVSLRIDRPPRPLRA